MKPRASDSLRLASYNIRKAVGTDRRRDPHRILGVIAGLDADIVALQEADRRLGARPSALPVGDIRSHTGLVPVPVSGDGPSLGWHGNALLVRPEAQVTGLSRLDLPGIEPRGAVAADLVLRGEPLRVIAVHLGLLRSSRRRQLSSLIEKLGTLAPIPTIIAGDLNEWSLDVGLGRMARHFTIHAPGKSFHANLPLGALDRIALDQNLEQSAAGVVDTTLARRASDHLPIWMDVRVKHAASGSPSVDSGAEGAGPGKPS